jgi:transcriptional regulator with XRE-family HTH domain
MSELQTTIEALGWSQRYAASRCGVTEGTLRWWAQGINARGNKQEVPPWALAYLRACLEAVDAIKPERPPGVSATTLRRRKRKRKLELELKRINAAMSAAEIVDEPAR